MVRLTIMPVNDDIDAEDDVEEVSSEDAIPLYYGRGVMCEHATDGELDDEWTWLFWG